MIIPTPPKKEATRMINRFKATMLKPGTVRETPAFGLSVPSCFAPELEPPETEVPDGPPAALILLSQVELRGDGVTTLAWPLKSQAEAALF